MTYLQISFLSSDILTFCVTFDPKIQKQFFFSVILNEIFRCYLIINQKFKIKQRKMGKKEVQVEGQKSSKRRFSTQCNYSILQTLLMKFLKQQNLYKKCQEVAQNFDISKEKNYTIIVLRISFFISYEIRKPRPREQIVSSLFNWLNNKLQDCIQVKYATKTKEFKRLVKKKVQEDLLVFEDVFSNTNFSNPESMKNILIRLYPCKGNKIHSKTHQKLASGLANYIQEVMKYEKSYTCAEKQKINLNLTSNSPSCLDFGCFDSNFHKGSTKLSSMSNFLILSNSIQEYIQGDQASEDHKKNMTNFIQEKLERSCNMQDDYFGSFDQEKSYLDYPLYLDPEMADSSLNQLQSFQILNQSIQRYNSVLKRPE